MSYPSRKDTRLYGQATSPNIIYGQGRGRDEPSHTAYARFKHYYHNNLVRDALPVHHPFVHTVTHSREGRSNRLYYPSRLQPHNTRGRHAPTRALPPFHTVTRHEKKGHIYRAEPQYFSFRAHETGCTTTHTNSTPSTPHRDTFSRQGCTPHSIHNTAVATHHNTSRQQPATIICTKILNTYLTAY